MASKIYYIGLVLFFAISTVNALGQVCDSLIFSEVSAFERKQVGIAQLETEQELIHVMFDDFDYAITFAAYNKEDLSEKRVFSWTKKAEKFPNLEIHVVEYFNGKIVVLYSYTNPETRELINMISIIESKGETLGAVELSRVSYQSRFDDISYHIYKSMNNSFLGISSSKPAFKNKDAEVEIHIFDRELEMIASKQISLPGLEKIAAPSQFQISELGLVYFLSGSDKEKAEIDGKLGLEKKVYQLYLYNFSKDKLKQFDVSIADKFISDVKMRLNRDGNLYVLGLYNNSHVKGAEGVFLMIIDGFSNQIIASGKKDLSLEIKKDFISDKRLQRNPVIDDLYLDHFYIKENGNIVFLGEVFFVDKRLVNTASVANLTTSIYYHFQEILVVELDSKLDYVQHQTIDKRQKSINEFSLYFGYSILNLNSEAPLIVYNYAKGKMDKNVAEVSANSRTSVFIQPLFSSDFHEIEFSERMKIAPGLNPELFNNYLVLQDKRTYKVGKLIF